MKTLAAIALAAAAALSAGCTPNIAPSTYSVGSVGQVNRTIAAVVVSVRAVRVDGAGGGGGLAGGAAGAVAGSSLGSSGRANAVGAIGGAVVGAVAGAAIERGASSQDALEYVVQTENDNLLTIVQGKSPLFAEGDRVLVLYGSPARLIADPRKAR